MTNCFRACLAIIVLAFADPCSAEELLPGKSSGVVIFDRWDACTLNNGIYTKYVSEKIKESLRQFAGQWVLIDVKKIYQPMNPGDGRIEAFEYIGDVSEESPPFLREDLKLTTQIEVDPEGRALGVITLKNQGPEPIELFSHGLAITLLTKRSAEPIWHHHADGPSFALITRSSFSMGLGGEPRWQSRGGVYGRNYSWSIGEENALPKTVTLEPDETKKIVVRFELPNGEYDFLCGYGGYTHNIDSIASNLSAFDIASGKSLPVKVKGR